MTRNDYAEGDRFDVLDGQMDIHFPDAESGTTEFRTVAVDHVEVVGVDGDKVSLAHIAPDGKNHRTLSFTKEEVAAAHGDWLAS